MISDDRSLLLMWLCCPAVQELVARTAGELVGALVAGHTASQENWEMMQTVLGSGVQVKEFFNCLLIRIRAQNPVLV